MKKIIIILIFAFSHNLIAQCDIYIENLGPYSSFEVYSNTVAADTIIPVCTGYSQILSTSNCTYCAGSYTWMPGNITGNSYTVSSSPGTYTVIGTSGACTTTYTFTTLINQPDTNQITVWPNFNPSFSGCIDSINMEGPAISYSILPVNSATFNPAYDYFYYQQAGINPTVNTTYTVIASNGGCTVGTPVAITVSVNPAPTLSFTVVQDTAPNTWDLYLTCDSNIYQLDWDWGDGTGSYTSYPSHTYTVPYNYTICVTGYYNGYYCPIHFCLADSLFANNSANDSIYVNVSRKQSQTTSINKAALSNAELRIYPNPGNGIIQIELGNQQVSELKIYDVTGKLVLSQPTPSPLKESKIITIDAGSLANGIYNVNITSNKGVVNKKLIISH